MDVFTIWGNKPFTGFAGTAPCDKLRNGRHHEVPISALIRGTWTERGDRSTDRGMVYACPAHAQGDWKS